MAKLELRSRLFIVSVVVTVTAQNRDELFRLSERLERASRKGATGWGGAQHTKRYLYLQKVFADPHFRGALRYAVFPKPTDKDLATIHGIVRALRHRLVLRRLHPDRRRAPLKFASRPGHLRP